MITLFHLACTPQVTAVPRFTETQQGEMQEVSVWLVWCLGRERGTPLMNLTGIPVPAQVHVRVGFFCCYYGENRLVSVFIWEPVSYHFLGRCFSRWKESRSRAESLIFFSWLVLLILKEGLSEQTAGINAVSVCAQFCLTFKCTQWAITGQSWGIEGLFRSEVRTLICWFAASLFLHLQPWRLHPVKRSSAQPCHIKCSDHCHNLHFKPPS